MLRENGNDFHMPNEKDVLRQHALPRLIFKTVELMPLARHSLYLMTSLVGFD